MKIQSQICIERLERRSAGATIFKALSLRSRMKKTNVGFWIQRKNRENHWKKVLFKKEKRKLIEKGTNKGYSKTKKKVAIHWKKKRLLKETEVFAQKEKNILFKERNEVKVN